MFYVLRFLLGSFEAGLYPGAVLYLTYWFPARLRARMLSFFTTSIPLSIIFGGPISGWIMGSMSRAGLANWQWLFVLEGIPSLIVGMLALLVVVDKPAQARWLTEAEKQLVLTDLEAEHHGTEIRKHRLLEALRLPKVSLLVTIHFCAVSTTVTIGFWVPTIIRSLGVKSSLAIGMLSTLPYIAAVIGMLLVSRHSDRTLERRYHAAIPCLTCAIGLVGIGVCARTPVLAFAALILAVVSPLCYNGPFWRFPPMLLGGTAAAGGIALINSLGTLSGWVAPWLVGWLEDVTGKTASGLYVVSGLEVLGAVLILLFMPRAAVRGELPRGRTT